ncbi:hypothetical protein NB725_004350 [Pantoea ananatis]|nr:hypothetical protein [Pantoea ananatis]MCW0341645.1 hypothetical protein [Pantoea ananatis]MCW0364740.1 hypothetical protein [Pantoea ananatis]
MKPYIVTVLIIFFVSVGLWGFCDPTREDVKNSVFFTGVALAQLLVASVDGMLGAAVICFLTKGGLFNVYFVLTALTALILADLTALVYTIFHPLPHKAWGVNPFLLLSIVLVPWFLTGVCMYYEERKMVMDSKKWKARGL